MRLGEAVMPEVAVICPLVLTTVGLIAATVFEFLSGNAVGVEAALQALKTKLNQSKCSNSHLQRRINFHPAK
jgi:hypothetical protein